MTLSNRLKGIILAVGGSIFCPASGCVIPAAGNCRHDFDYSARALHYNQEE